MALYPGQDIGNGMEWHIEQNFCLVWGDGQWQMIKDVLAMSAHLSIPNHKWKLY
jgi:hypothetical protein